MNTQSHRLEAALAAATGQHEIALQPDALHMALLDGDREEMERLAVRCDDSDVQLTRLQRMAETAYSVHKLRGMHVTLHMVAWPFMVNFPAGGRVPAQFDMGDSSEPTGRRMLELWSAMIAKGPGVMVHPLRLGLHAHSIYSVAPDVVQRFIGSVAGIVGLEGARIPRGIPPVERNAPMDAGGILHAPVLLQALVATPDDEPVSFVRDFATMETARQLVASKLGLTTGAPQVVPLMPAPFFSALESTLQAENLAMALWQGGQDITTAMTVHYDRQGSRELQRNANMKFHSRGEVVDREESFDVRWMRQGAIRKSLSELQRVAGSEEVRRFFLSKATAADALSRHN